MTNRYEKMEQLRDHLNELFRICGIEAQPVDVELAPMLVRLVEKLVRDHALYQYLEELDRQVQKNVPKMRLDVWNNEQNERRLEAQEAELAEQRRQLDGLENELAGQRRRAEQLEEALGAEQKAHANLRHIQLEMVQNLISVRDKLLMRKSWIEDQAPEEKNALKVVENQLTETAKCLTAAGVEVLDGIGAFDSRLHTVVETRTAERPEQVDQIAETFRPGYRFQGEILRAQEVILFGKA